jgi:hypothetical protein
MDVPYIPWLNQHHCVLPGGPPYHPDVSRLTEYVQDVVLDEAGRPISDYVYLNLEEPMSILAPWHGDRGEIYRDCIYIAKAAMGWKYPLTKLFVYASLQGAWRRKQQPHQLWHGLIEPYVDALALSLYGYSKLRSWQGSIDEDLDMAVDYMGWYNPTYCHDRPRVLFVWGFHKGQSQYYPLNMWETYIRGVKALCREGDVVCWFGAGRPGYQDDQYGPQIVALKEILAG